ncbi:MAG TPA: glycosyl transferase family 36 [Chloroflexi bacterium]|nr:glycosyl transferase family 36 [Chloroflexota bacterium]
MAQFETRYGYFSDDGREYIIVDPQTPMPWINVLTNGDYGVTISQAGSGYSWRTHASLNRITRWEQDLIRDEWGKYIYLRDADSGEFWSPTLQPCGRVTSTASVRHGPGYTIFSSTYQDIASQLTLFVPLDAPCELWLLQLQNRGQKARTLQIFTYFEWLLGAAPDWHREFHRTFIETFYDVSTAVLLAEKALWELPGKHGWNHSWPYVAFHSASLRPVGFESDKRAFLGRHGAPSAPQAVMHGVCSGHHGRSGDPIGALQLAVTLPPGGAIEIAFSLGAADNRTQALAVASRYHDLANVHDALERVQHFWRHISAPLQIETPEPAVNLLANTWLPLQAIAGRLWGRTAYYQTGGAYGYRDQLQDSLIWLLLGQPERTLAQIRLHAAHQYQDGVVLHWWHPLAESGLRSEYSDDLLWLPFVLWHYLQETADFNVLDEEIPFFDGGSATLREHCQRAFRLALSRRSARGLPLILAADWNDGMNAVGVRGQGESVWMAHFLHFLLTRWAELPVLDTPTRIDFEREAAALRAAVNEHGWDGAWYWRASTDDGALLGAHHCTEGQIFLNAQTWSVISGAAPAGRAQMAMASAHTHLYTDYGPLLFAPAYTHPDPTIGYLSRYAPGVRENGGVYVHAACWAVLADSLLNGADAAYTTWRSFCPPLRSQLDPDRYSAEPYVMPGNVLGPLAETPGRAGWTWYTGSAQWCLRALVEGVLGIQATLDGLRVRPDLPKTWDRFYIRRRFRGADYEILVRRAAPDEAAGYRVDGVPWQEDILPLAAPGSVQRVEITVA